MKACVFVAVVAIVAACDSGSTRRGGGASGGVGATDGGSGGSLDDGTGGSDNGTGGHDTGSGVGGDADGSATGGPLCQPDEAECIDDVTRRICAPTGGEWLEDSCPGEQKCWAGQCGDVTCVPDTKLEECGGPASTLICNDVGTLYVPAPCKGGTFCYKGECLNLQCEPDSRTCVGFSAVQQCASDGSAWELIETCEKGGTCFDGVCISACDVNLKAATYNGCEYYAVDMDNIEGGQFEPVALVVSVPSSVENSTVTVVDSLDDHVLTPFELGVTSMVVPAGSLQVFELPLNGDLDGSGVSRNSYRVTTSAPATVHQFNPLNGSEVFTNDASLLLPTQAGGTEYYVMSWPMRADEFESLRGNATVIATQPGITQVTVVPRSDVETGAAGSGVGFIERGIPTTFVLEQGQVLNLETAGEQGADLTGTRITSTQRIAVFGGHECANVPLGINACDHLEQQLVPVAAWGQRYIADAFAARSAGQFDIYRVMAGSTDVVVTTNPPQKGYESFLLQPGSFVTFKSSEHFEIKATGKILVGHYMIGSSYPGHVQTCKKTGIGDPAFTIAVSTQQFLTEYTVLTPPGYAENYINVIAPAGADVTVDGLPLPPSSGLSEVAPGLGWAVAQHKVEPGVHTVVAKKKIGLTAYGYDCDVSYAYPGGLRLSSLEIQP